MARTYLHFDAMRISINNYNDFQILKVQGLQLRNCIAQHTFKFYYILYCLSCVIRNSTSDLKFKLFIPTSKNYRIYRNFKKILVLKNKRQIKKYHDKIASFSLIFQ